MSIKSLQFIKPTNAHIISEKKLLKHFKTLRHVSILSDHHQGALFLAKVMLQYSQFITTGYATTTPRLKIPIEL